MAQILQTASPVSIIVRRSPEECPEEIAMLIRECLSPDPEARPDSTVIFHILQQQAVLAPALSTPEATPRDGADTSAHLRRASSPPPPSVQCPFFCYGSEGPLWAGLLHSLDWRLELASHCLEITTCEGYFEAGAGMRMVIQGNADCQSCSLSQCIGSEPSGCSSEKRTGSCTIYDLCAWLCAGLQQESEKSSIAGCSARSGSFFFHC